MALWAAQSHEIQGAHPVTPIGWHRAVGALFVSPALQRGVGESNNSSGVP